MVSSQDKINFQAEANDGQSNYRRYQLTGPGSLHFILFFPLFPHAWGIFASRDVIVLHRLGSEHERVVSTVLLCVGSNAALG